MKRLLGKLALLAFISMSSAFLGACGEPNRSLNLSRNSTELSSVPWTRQFGSRHDDWATSMALDQRGNILVSGYTKGSLPGQTNAGLSDAFVHQFDSNGNELFTQQFGSSNDLAQGAAGEDRKTVATWPPEKS